MAAVVNTRDLTLQNTSPRLVATSVTGTTFGGVFTKAKNGATTVSPSSLTLTVVTTGFTNTAVFVWEYGLGASPTTWFSTGSNSNTLNISNSSFVATGVAIDGIVTYRVTVTQGGYSSSSTTFTVTYVQETDDPIFANIDKPSTVLQATDTGVVSVFTGSGATITARRGSTALTYGTGAGQYDIGTVTISPVGGVTLGTNTNGVYSNITAMDSAQDVVTVTYTVRIRDLAGTISTRDVVQVFTKSKAGAAGVGKVLTLNVSGLTFVYDGVGNLSPAGQYITFTANRPSITGTVNWTTTPNVSLSSSSSSQSNISTGDTVYLLAAAFGTNTSVKVTATVVESSITYTDSNTVVRLQNGSNAINAILGNETHAIPTDSAGTNAVYTNSGTLITVYQGSTQLTYNGVGTTASTWTVSASGTSITPGSVSTSGSSALYNAHNSITADTASITYTITGRNANNEAFTLTKVQTFVKNKQGIQGNTGPTGPTGSTGPAGTSGAGTYLIYIQGTASTPATPSATTNGATPAGWSSTPITTFTGGNDRQWQSDGFYAAGTYGTANNTTWSTPYESYLKVANLSAVSANTGTLSVTSTITVGTSGSIFSSGKTSYSNTTAGFFLGYDSTAYKFRIGDSTKSLGWDGTSLSITGASLSAPSITSASITNTDANGSFQISGADLIGKDTGNNDRFKVNTSVGIVTINGNSTVLPALSITPYSSINAYGILVQSSSAIGIRASSSSSNAIEGETSSNKAGVKGTATGSGGVGVEGRSDQYYGGAFYGNTNVAPLYINPNGALPTQGLLTGGVCVVGTHIYFYNGTNWVQLD